MSSIEGAKMDKYDKETHDASEREDSSIWKETSENLKIFKQKRKLLINLVFVVFLGASYQTGTLLDLKVKKKLKSQNIIIKNNGWSGFQLSSQ